MAEVAADGKPNGVGYFEIRFRTFPPGDPRGNDGFSSDVQEFAAHGGPNTHLDALCHDSNKQGQLFNGYPLAETVTEREGCKKLGIDKWSTGIVTRGILVDMSRLKGSKHVPGSAVFTADLEAWERQTGLRVSPGDALFVYDPGPMGDNGRPRNGGFDISVAPWMHARGVALTGGFARTPGVVDEARADHRLTIAGMGLPLLDGADLSRLAETAAQQKRWEFMLVIAPIAAPGGTGSIVNPLAMF
jgi:Putative cyclase